MIFLFSLKLFKLVNRSSIRISKMSSSFGNQISNVLFCLMKKSVQEFLESREKGEKISSLLNSFDEEFVSFLKEKQTLSFDSDDITSLGVKVSVPSALKSKKKSASKKQSTRSKEHIDGQCSHKFNSGDSKGEYCNKDVVDETDFCKSHQPKPKKDVETPCEFVSKAGKECGKESKEEHEGKNLCGLHLYTVKKQQEKKETTSSSSEKKKNSDKKKKVVDSDDENENEDSHDEKVVSKKASEKKKSDKKKVVDSDEEEVKSKGKGSKGKDKSKGKKVSSDTESDSESKKGKSKGGKGKKQPVVEEEDENEESEDDLY